jgi:hypothetical protein
MQGRVGFASMSIGAVGPDEPVAMAGGFQHFGFKLDLNDHDRVIRQVEKAGGKLVSRGQHGGRFPYAYVVTVAGRTEATLSNR